jgi:hypothetical protein
MSTVEEQFGIDPIAGAQHLTVTTYEDGTVLVDGSMVPTAVPCSEAAWTVQVAADQTRVAGWKADIATNEAAYNAAHPERAQALADLIASLPEPT